MSEKQARASEREGRLCPSSQKKRKIGARVGLLRKRCTRHIPWLKLLCVFLDQNCRSFFGSGSGYFKDKDKFLCCHVPRISFLWSISSPSVQSAFPPSSSSSSLFVSSEKLFCDKKGALHVFRGDWEGRAKSYDTGTRFLQRARARSHTLSYPFVDAHRGAR